MSLDSQSPTAPCESSSLATRWEACHWIRGSQSSPMNPVPLPPPQFGGAAKGKRLNGQARRLTSPHLEVLCRTSTGDYKAPLCCELLMKGLLCVSLLSHRSAGGRWCRKAPNPHALRRHYERKRAFDTMKTGGGQSVPLLGLELAHQTVSASSFEPHFVNGLCR